MQRKYYLDNICCVLIIHMIYTCHIPYSCGGFYPTIISFTSTTLSFFMSWFFFKSGMMHKAATTKEIANKSAKRLLVPYLAFLIIGFIIDGIIFNVNTPERGLRIFVMDEMGNLARHLVLESTAASWFLLSLFVAKIAFNALCNKIHPLLLTLLFACAAYAVHLASTHGFGFDIHLGGRNVHFDLPPYYIGTMCHGLSVYSLGYYLREKQFDTKIFVAATILFILKYYIPAGINFRMNTSNNYLLAVIYGMSGCVAINNIVQRWVNIKIPLVTYIGENSMVYYLAHYPVMCTMIYLFWEPFEDKKLWIRYIVLSFVVTVSLIIADYLFKNKRLRFIIGG